MTERVSERANGVTGSVWVVRFYYLVHELNYSSVQLNSTRDTEYLLYFYPLHGPRGDVRAFSPSFRHFVGPRPPLRHYFVLPPYQILISFLG